LEDPPPRDYSPLGAALEWVGRITAIGLLMVFPILGGHYLDHWLGTEFLGVVGMIVGFVAGLASLLVMTGVWSGRRK
jgi:hypothetical protein